MNLIVNILIEKRVTHPCLEGVRSDGQTKASNKKTPLTDIINCKYIIYNQVF